MAGRHRAPRKSIPVKKLTAGTVLGFTALGSLAIIPAAFASPTSEDNAPLTQADRIPLPEPSRVTYDDTEFDPATMEPAAEGDGLDEFSAWVAAGMPGYVAAQGGEKGVKDPAVSDNGVGGPSVPVNPAHNWDAVAQCESSGVWDLNTGNGYYGGLQIWDLTWADFGGHEYAPLPHLATKEQQIIVAERILAVQGKGAWPNCGQYLQESAPIPAPRTEPDCPLGPGSNLGLTANADFVYRALCFHFPQITTYGGLRPGDPQDHGTGNAVDAMTYNDTATGDAVVAFLLANIDRFSLKYVIFKQQIYGPWNGWTAEWMEDRGSVTQNHYDHVHVSVN